MLFCLALVTVTLDAHWRQQSTCFECSPFRSRHMAARFRVNSSACRHVSGRTRQTTHVTAYLSSSRVPGLFPYTSDLRWSQTRIGSFASGRASQGGNSPHRRTRSGGESRRRRRSSSETSRCTAFAPFCRRLSMFGEETPYSEIADSQSWPAGEPLSCCSSALGSTASGTYSGSAAEHSGSSPRCQALFCFTLAASILPLVLDTTMDQEFLQETLNYTS